MTVIAEEEPVARRRMLIDADREEISRGIAAGQQQKQIAARIGRSPSVVCREIRRHGGRLGYRAVPAGQEARQARSRPRARRLDADLVLQGQVTRLLQAGRSPDQAAGRLRYLAGGSHAGSVSAEAISTWIYALPKGELAARGILLRSGRTQRKPRMSPPSSVAWNLVRLPDTPVLGGMS